MKILFISGSPRKNGNTASVIKKITENLKEHEIEILYLSDYKLNGCLGCNHCQKY